MEIKQIMLDNEYILLFYKKHWNNLELILPKCQEWKSKNVITA